MSPKVDRGGKDDNAVAAAADDDDNADGDVPVWW